MKEWIAVPILRILGIVKLQWLLKLRKIKKVIIPKLLSLDLLWSCLRHIVEQQNVVEEGLCFLGVLGGAQQGKTWSPQCWLFRKVTDLGLQEQGLIHLGSVSSECFFAFNWYWNHWCISHWRICLWKPANWYSRWFTNSICDQDIFDSHKRLTSVQKFPESRMLWGLNNKKQDSKWLIQ